MKKHVLIIVMLTYLSLSACEFKHHSPINPVQNEMQMEEPQAEPALQKKTNQKDVITQLQCHSMLQALQETPNQKDTMFDRSKEARTGETGTGETRTDTEVMPLFHKDASLIQPVETIDRELKDQLDVNGSLQPVKVERSSVNASMSKASEGIEISKWESSFMSQPINQDPPVWVNTGRTETHEYVGPKSPYVTTEMQTAVFWLNLYPLKDKIILAKDGIKQYNENNATRLPFLSDPSKWLDKISGDEIMKWIDQLSVIPQSNRYDSNGKEYQPADYAAMQTNLNKENILEQVEIQYGLTVKRTQMRTWPTYNASLSKPGRTQIDYFTETAVYPAEPVAIYHVSNDGNWYFAQIYHYKAWIPAEDVALCTREEWAKFQSYEDLLLIKGAFIHTPDSTDERFSKLQLDMGVALPVHRENANRMVVLYPVRDESALVEFIPIQLPATTNTTRGYLEYTTSNVLTQAFRFLGEQYGWGGMFNARDCTSFLVDIYRTFGIRLPRNSNQQEKVQGAISFKGMNRSVREAVLDGLRPGSALYMPGHAMMYLGKYQGRHFIIHDITTVYQKGVEGKLIPVHLNQVSVTPLDMCNSKDTEYLMNLTAAVVFE